MSLEGGDVATDCTVPNENHVESSVPLDSQPTETNGTNDKVDPTSNGQSTKVETSSDAPVKKETSKESSSRRDRDSERRRRSHRQSPIRSSRSSRGSNSNSKVYVCNFPFETTWSELKDFFRENIGHVKFCDLFKDESGKPRGCALVEFDNPATAEKACETLNRATFKGRQIVVKEDYNSERDRCGRLIRQRDSSSRRDRERSRSRERSRRRDHDRDRHRYDERLPPRGSDSYNTYGLSQDFLNSLGIYGPLNNRIFISNLDFKVTENKIESVFKMAGNIRRIKLFEDRNGVSRGNCIIEFEHPVEAVQAISMFNNQKLYDRTIAVRLDLFDDKETFRSDRNRESLPTGLESIGKGLGLGGQPLNIAQTVVNSPAVIPPAALPATDLLSGVVGTNPVQAAQTALAALTSLAGISGNLQSLPNLAQTLAQLTSAVNHNSAPLATPQVPVGYNQPPPVVASHPIPQTGSDLNSGSTSHASYYNSSSYQQPVPPLQSTVSNVPAASGMYSSSSYGQVPASQTSAEPLSSYASAPSYHSTQSASAYTSYDHRSSNASVDTVLVRGLPLTFNWQNLRDLFGGIGEVRFAETKGHGDATIRFANERDAQKAVDLMNGTRVENRSIEVRLYY